ncbi:hypothetical protein [Nocardia sp. alder85J]|uniref:hypothetical protein n=1 Tax=Nocardia sp. alder85J TaxID=2862949 RepID=UPI001CD1DBD3|nr:hypothetical protein [Nocardia sp. alder85J]MCX4092891.1 hypothetical protein [Nocardia sp. alder85J]
MTIHTTDATMTSDRSPEYAYRAAGVWRLSWLPQQLTHDQALAGMRLDELLSDPDMVHDATAADRIAAHAADLGVRYEHAVILLSRRMAARTHRPPRPAPPERGEPAPGAGRSAPRSLHLLG